MARELIVKMTDDLDRSLEATEVKEVGYGGRIYVLDLTTEHAKELDELLAPYLDAAHEKVRWPKRQLADALKTSATPQADSGPASTRTFSKEERQKIRTWARRNGFEVADRGYISSEVVEAYLDRNKARKHA